MLELTELVQFIVGLVMAAAAAEAVTEILITGSILNIIGLRPWAARLALPADNNFASVRWYHTALHTLLTCGYCGSVWVSGVCALAVPGDWFGLWPQDNLLIKIVVVHRLSNWLHDAYQLLQRGRVLTVDATVRLSHDEPPDEMAMQPEGVRERVADGR